MLKEKNGKMSIKKTVKKEDKKIQQKKWQEDIKK